MTGTAQTALVAEQTTTMIMADVIIDLAAGLAENTGDPRIVDAVLGAVRDAIARADTAFVLPGQPPLESRDEARAVDLARSRAAVMADMIEQACRDRLAAQIVPKN